jgi:hypothetical protein
LVLPCSLHDLIALKAYQEDTYQGVFDPVGEKSCRDYARTTAKLLLYLLRLQLHEPNLLHQDLRQAVQAFRGNPTVDRLHLLFCALFKPHGGQYGNNRHPTASFVRLNSKDSKGSRSVTVVSHTLVHLMHTARLVTWKELRLRDLALDHADRAVILRMTRIT